MSFLKKLFGIGGSGDEAGTEPVAAEAQDYKGFSIRAAPFKADGQYQTCAIVTKEIAGVVKEHRLIRADRFAALDAAVDVSIRKARQMIDEQGERLFG